MKLHYPGNALARYRDQTAVKGKQHERSHGPELQVLRVRPQPSDERAQENGDGLALR